MLKIACWNVNSVRSRLENLDRYIKEQDPDVLLLQEAKCLEAQFPYDFFEDYGYNIAASLQKTYNGVVIASKYPIDDVRKGIINNEEDIQARFVEGIISVRSHVIRLVSVYVPNGSEVGSDKFQYKLDFLEKLRDHLEEISQHEEIQIIAGDYNVAPEEIDVYDAKTLEGKIGFHIEERKRFRSLLNLGYKDAFRLLYPNKCQFSWWDYRSNGWKYQRGMRIDNVLVSPDGTKVLQDVVIHEEVRGWDKTSDHAPIMCYLKI